MVLLPGCPCCGEDNCGCLPPYPDFIDLECSLSSSVSSGTLESVQTYTKDINGGYADDVYTAKRSANVQPYSNQTFRLAGDKDALGAGPIAQQGTIPYYYTESGSGYPQTGGGIYSELTVTTPPGYSSSTGGQCGLMWELKFFGHGTEQWTRTLAGSGITPLTDTQSQLYLSSQKTYTGIPLIRVKCSPTLDSFPYARIGPPTRTQSTSFSFAESCTPGPYFVFDRRAPGVVLTSGTDVAICIVSRSCAGTNDSVWPFQMSFRKRYGLPRGSESGSFGWNYTTVNTKSGFSSCNSSADFDFYCVDYTFTIHSAKMWYGETAVDFPLKPVYGAAPSGSY